MFELDNLIILSYLKSQFRDVNRNTVSGTIAKTRDVPVGATDIRHNGRYPRSPGAGDAMVWLFG